MSFDITERELRLQHNISLASNQHNHYHNSVSSSSSTTTYIAMEIDPTSRMRKKLATNPPQQQQPSYNQVKSGHHYQTELNYRFQPTFTHQSHRAASLSSTKQQLIKPTTKSTYFSIESLMLLLCLTASLLILPLVLPPLPPPPFMLLLLPIGIFGLLMVLAFMPCNVRDLTYKYM